MYHEVHSSCSAEYKYVSVAEYYCYKVFTCSHLTITLAVCDEAGPPRPGMLPTPPMGGPPMMPMMGPPPHGMMPGGPGKKHVALVASHELLSFYFSLVVKRFLSCVSHQCHMQEAWGHQWEGRCRWCQDHHTWCGTPVPWWCRSDQEWFAQTDKVEGRLCCDQQILSGENTWSLFKFTLNPWTQILSNYDFFYFLPPLVFITIHPIWISFRIFYETSVDFIKQHPQFLVSLGFTVQNSYSIDLMIFSLFLLCCWFKMFLYLICIGLGNKTMLWNKFPLDSFILLF